MTPVELDCTGVVGLLSDRLDDALPPAERHAVDEHLGRCARCSALLDQLRQTVDALRRLPAEPLSAKVEARLLAVFRALNGERGA